MILLIDTCVSKVDCKFTHVVFSLNYSLNHLGNLCRQRTFLVEGAVKYNRWMGLVGRSIIHGEVDGFNYSSRTRILLIGRERILLIGGEKFEVRTTNVECLEDL